MGLVGIGAGVTKRSALAQQIPALVELHGEVVEPAAILLAEGRTLRGALMELVLLVNERIDAGDDVRIVHDQGDYPGTGYGQAP